MHSATIRGSTHLIIDRETPHRICRCPRHLEGTLVTRESIDEHLWGRSMAPW